MNPMSQHEYIIVFISLILGLGIADLLGNLRELIHPRRSVDWHLLPLLWVGLAILLVAQAWWAFYGLSSAPVWNNYFAFVVPLLWVMGLYLFCSFALPGEQAGDHVDLERFYYSDARRTWFFGALAMVLVTAQIMKWMQAEAIQWESSIAVRLAGVGLLGSLIATDHKEYHWGATLVGIALCLFFSAHYALQLSG